MDRGVWRRAAEGIANGVGVRVYEYNSTRGGAQERYVSAKMEVKSVPGRNGIQVEKMCLGPTAIDRCDPMVHAAYLTSVLPLQNVLAWCTVS